MKIMTPTESSVRPSDDKLSLGMKQQPTKNVSRQLMFKVLTDFCEDTSMHGLGQIVKHTVLVAKFVWLAAFLGALAGNTYHITTLVQQYYSRPVQEVTKLHQKQITFPAVTVCNLDPISKTNFEAVYDDDGSRVRKYLDRVERMYQTGVIESSEYDVLNSPLLIRVNVGAEEAKAGSHQLRDLILRCKFRGSPCNITQDFKFILNALMFNCYTFEPGDRGQNFTSTGAENGLSLLMYLESMNGTRATSNRFAKYDHDANGGNSVGVRVVVHSPGVFPITHMDGMDIMPGHSTSIGFKVEEVSRLPDPYGDCIRNETLAGISGYRYSPIPCLNACLQERFIDKCGCKSTYQPVPDVHDDDIYCGTLIDDDDVTAMELYRSQLPCTRSEWIAFSSSPEERDACGCNSRCTDALYTYEVTESKWPAPKFYKSFLQEEIMDRPDRWELKVFRELWKVIEDHIFDPTKDSNYDFLTENFARLNVFLRDAEVVQREQTPAYQLSNLFSDVGGTLGLWAGLSLLTILEILQVFVRFILIAGGKRNLN